MDKNNSKPVEPRTSYVKNGKEIFLIGSKIAVSGFVNLKIIFISLPMMMVEI